MVGVIGVYPRVSTGQQVAGGTSLEEQTELCIRKALEMGFTNDQIRVYREEGMTGEDIDRPAMNLLRDDVAAGLISHVICVHPDRLSRDLTDKLVVCREFEKVGAQLSFVDTEYANSPEGQLFFNIQSSIAQYELALIKKRTTRGRLATVKKEHKVMPMRVPPFGYDVVDHQLVINQDEARFVKIIYEWYVFDRFTMRQIGEKLRELGCYPKRGESPYWNNTSIRRILTSEIYIGHYYYNRRVCKKVRGEKTKAGNTKRTLEFRDPKDWIMLEVPAIIDEATFEMAQKVKNSNKKMANGVKNEYLLRSLLKCGECGYNWVCTSYKTKAGPTPIYRCNNKYLRKYAGTTQGCSTRSIRADLLDKYVWDQITELVLNPDVFLRLSAMKDDSSTASIRNTLAAVESQIAAKEKEKSKVRTMFMRDAINEDEMAASMSRIKKESDALNNQAEEYNRLLTASARKLKSTDMVKKMIASVGQGIEDEKQGIKTLSLREKRSIIDLLVNEIIIEFQGDEVVLTYIGIIDELLQKRIAESAATKDIPEVIACLQPQEI
jgi:site-specific DNA recombinase